MGSCSEVLISGSSLHSRKLSLPNIQYVFSCLVEPRWYELCSILLSSHWILPCFFCFSIPFLQLGCWQQLCLCKPEILSKGGGPCNSCLHQDPPAADVDVSAPSAKAAIAYIGETLGLDTCGELAKGYIKTLENGGSAEDAVAAARSLYRVNFFARGSPAASAACKAAEGAYKAAFYSGRDPVTAAAEAYLSASPADSPCASAAKAFASATAADAKAGRSTVDAKCAKAAAAY